MNKIRHVCLALAAVLTVVDAGLHLRRSLVPVGNPFGSPLHQQFLLYAVVAVLLVVGLLVAQVRLGQRAWIASAMLMVWELGALGVWLFAYHAPNPPGLVPDEGYVSKFLELLIVVVLLPTLRVPGATRQAQGTSGAPS